MSGHIQQMPSSTWQPKTAGLGFPDPLLVATTSTITSVGRCIQLVETGGKLPLDPHFASMISEMEDTPTPQNIDIQQYQEWLDWETSQHPTFTAFRYSSRVLRNYSITETHQDDDPTSNNNTQAANSLREFSEMNYRACIPPMSHTANKVAFEDTLDSLPPEEAEIIQNLSSKLTSIPFSNTTMSHKPYVMTAERFRMMLKRKLRLPILPLNHTITCKCGTKVDRHLDHFLACNSHSKTPLHHTIRDAMADILQGIGPLLQITNEADVQLEKRGLLECEPSVVPGDVNVLNGQLPDQLPVINIDITIMSSPKEQNITQVEDDRKAQFERTENVKLIQYRPRTNNDNVLREMNGRRMGLIPFVVDPHGNIGPMATKLLFDGKVRLGNKRDPTGFSNKESHLLLERSIGNNSLVGILRKANKKYHAEPVRPASFCPKTGAHTPSDWAIQHLSCNVFHALSCHLLKALATTKLRNEPPSDYTRFGLYAPASNAVQKFSCPVPPVTIAEGP